MLAENALYRCGQAGAGLVTGDLRRPRSRIVSYSQWRAIAATAATRLANAMSSPVTSMSSPFELCGETTQEGHGPDQGANAGLGLGHARHHGASPSRYS
jgi:hypothetical protein